MANKKLSEGVGKKIVEALKKQSEIEINSISDRNSQEDFETFDEIAETFGDVGTESPDAYQEDDNDFLDEFHSDDYSESLMEKQEAPAVNQPFVNYQALTSPSQDSFIKDLDSFEIPSNIAVLKKLISQLPSGVTRHTGAQIIKQTMEALGISMKSVLQEAQQVQDGLNNSVKECHSNIQEYKKQILVLEKQSQNYQRQYTALNELISLFIQTGV